MRVVFVAGRCWPAVGGVETLVRHVATSMSREHEVTVLALRNDEGRETRLSNGLTLPPPFEPYEDGRVRYEPIVLSKRRRACLLPLALQEVPVARRYAYTRIRGAYAALYASVVGEAIARQAGEADVVHTWTTDLLAAAGVKAAQLLDARSVITPFLHVGQWGADRTSVATYRKADRVVGLLESERQSLIELGVPAERVGVCGACTPGLERNGTPPVRERHEVDGPIVLFLGARRPYKGIDLILEAAPAVSERVPGVTFAFVGPGAPVDPPRGVKTIDAGKVETPELAAWLEGSDLLCLPSAHEIFPTSILEAWSFGTPALTSDIDTLRELMSRSGGGEVAPRDAGALAEQLIAMLSDPEGLRERGESGRAFWRDHNTPDAVADRYLSQYEELPAGAPAGA